MTSLPSFVRYEQHEVCLIFDLRRGAAEPVHLGRPLPAEENLTALCDALRRGRHGSQPDRPMPRSILPQAGWGDDFPPAIVLQGQGGPLTPRLELEAAEQSSRGLCFTHRDAENGLRVDVTWLIHESGLVSTKSALTNSSSATIEVVELASLALPLPAWASHAVRYAGRWAGEMQQRRMAIEQGEFGGASFGGRPGFGGANWIRIESADAAEHHSAVLAAHLAWSGDHRLRVVRAADGHAMLMLAARLDPGEISLAPGASFTTPQALFAVSASGILPARQAFHRQALTQAFPPPVPPAPRKVHINSWEALAFDQSLPKLTALADSAAALGVERFVLDDGWFRGRRDDTTSLGDWTPDAGLFPAGLTPLIRHVEGLGMDFGLWVEPEMVSPDSQLYRTHPDWCLHLPGQPRPTQRGQLVLDLTRPEVADHLFGQIDALLSGNAIAYLKWDHNRELFPLAGKGHAQVHALYALLDRIRAAHPRVEIETCASGGGRVDFEVLKRCNRYWASDNNDAVERLRINAGWLDFLPLAMTGNHVGPSPNPITGRRLAMDFRAKVAMFGHMGVEADPVMMTAGERASLAAHIALYQEWRHVLHSGTLMQLADRHDGLFGWLALTASTGLALVAQTHQSSACELPPVRFPGLDPDACYRVRLLKPWCRKAARSLAQPELWAQGVTLSGQTLARSGISLPLSQPETAWLVLLERQ
ncbi:MAG: alpha-galactosidase [Novosphingobium sp.]|nr:alpha-galactosidase [Novosphingobium sp.]